MRTTHYQHKTEVDEASGTFFYDCSGLLDYALGRVLPTAASALPTSTSALADTALPAPGSALGG